MSEPLNPYLYRRLKRLFGYVEIGNEGESLLARPTRGTHDEPRLLISHPGEYYKVNCPYCRDTRKRLWVNYQFGQRDGHGRKMTFMAVCYNEGCLAIEENKADFLDRMGDAGGFLEKVRVREGKVVPEEAREVHWPGPCTRLDKLKKDHDARLYIAARGFDPDLLARKYQVCYCTRSDYFLAQDRIIIPVFEKDRLKGWQARHIGELAWKDPDKKRFLPPKYFSCPNSHFRSKCIYNWDRLREWQTAVICEGPTDVWRFGAMAGCVFGNTMTDAQQRKLLAVFRKRTAVLLLDPEEFESRATRRLLDTMERCMPGAFCAVRLPAGTDPGSLGRDFLRDYVKEHARDQGVKVSYRKVA